MLLTVCYIALVIVLYLILSRYCKNDDKKYKYAPETPEGKKERFFDPPKNLSALTKLAIAAAVVITGLFIFTFDVFIEDYWLFFGEKRTAFIEDRYDIIVDDDIRLKKYMLYFGGPDGAISRLELECDIDCKSFFEKNCRGELVYYTENGMVYYADGTKEEYWEESSESEDILCYRSNRTRSAKFQKDGDKFYVTFR